MALTTVANIKAWANPNLGATRDTELTRCIAAGDAWVKRVLDWNIEEQDTVTIILDGRDALGGNVLLIPVKYRPVVHSGSDLVTVTESDSSLTVNAGYDGTSDVILLGANEEKRCEMVKPHSSWLRDYGNVTVVMKCGYASPASLPADIVQLATEVAWLIFSSGQMVGKASKSVRGGSVTFKDQLTTPSRELIDRIHEEIV